MIVTRTGAASRTGDPAGGSLRIRCLARRGMLHSECEAVDYIALPASTGYALTGRDGAEAVWVVLRGAGVAAGTGPLADADVLLASDDGAVRIVAGDDGLELLCVRTLPDRVSRRLPRRRPVT